MATYLYLLLSPARSEAPPHDLAGVLDAPVRAFTATLGESVVEAWVSSIEDLPSPEADRAAIASLAMRHNAVVDAALATGRTPLPARFGQRFTDDDACIADIERRAASLLPALERVAGCVEMGVLLIERHATGADIEQRKPAVATVKEPGAGRRYLEARREHLSREAQRRGDMQPTLAALHEATVSLVRGESVSFSTPGVWSVLHLVPRELVVVYREAIARVAGTLPLRVVHIGPRAPYGFTDPVRPVGREGHDSGSLISSD